MFSLTMFLFCCWLITITLWCDHPRFCKSTKYIYAGLWLLAFLLLDNKSGNEDENLGLILGIFALFCCIVINVIAKIIAFFWNADWNDPDFILGLEERIQRLSSLSSSGTFSNSGNKSRERYGSYVIQIRRNGTWIDGPSSNSEDVAENMFDRFIQNDSRSSNRCRLVYKVNGRVKQVLSTN